MFIKLTRIDGTPVWINASFVVTVEPYRGGTLVVPVGDGLDYEVREKPEAVLAMLDGAPAAAVLPVPAVDALAPTPADVSPESAPASLPEEPAAKPKAAKKTSARKSAAKKKSAASAETKEEPEPATEAEAEPKKAAKRKSEDEVQAEFQAAVAGEEAPKKKRASKKKSEEFVPTLTEEQVERLKKMMPGRIPALNNTLSSQFGVAPAYADATREWLVKQGVMAMVGNRIAWL